MKKQVPSLSDKELEAYPLADLLEGWFFRVREVFYGVYHVEGTDRWGRTVSRIGEKPKELIVACVNDAREIALCDFYVSDFVKALMSSNIPRPTLFRSFPF